MTNAIIVRLFDPADTASVERISADSALYGDPVELILNDRRLFFNIFVRMYLMHFPHTCWVAEREDHVVGYLTGCLDTPRSDQLFRQNVRQAARRAFFGHYHWGWHTLRAGVSFLREVLAYPPDADLERYPAHLHINLAASFRGQGIGQQLMHTFLDYCCANHMPGVHLNTSDQNVAALHLYRRLDFGVLHRYRSLYKSIVSRRSVEALIMGLQLD